MEKFVRFWFDDQESYIYISFYSVSFDFTKKKMERIWKMRIQRGGEKHVHPRNDLIGREEKLIINESLRRVDNT